MDDDVDFAFKIVVVGESGVGKTQLALRYCTDKFSAESKATIGIEFFNKSTQLPNGTKIRASLWDTAGQERFRSITPAYYTGADGAVIVYDITKYSSFESVKTWLKELVQFTEGRGGRHSRTSSASSSDGGNQQFSGVSLSGSRKLVVMLVGNKLDLASSLREVEMQEAMQFARQHGLLFMEASALDSTNVRHAFDSLAQHIYDRLTGKEPRDSTVEASDEQQQQQQQQQQQEIQRPDDSAGENNIVLDESGSSGSGQRPHEASTSTSGCAKC